MQLYSPTEKLTIFYPAFNEEHYIERAVEAAEEVCQLMLAENEISDFEILIINDGSSDRTAKIADQLATSDRRVRVLHHTTNRGLGAAIKTGFSAAQGDIILYTDIDLPFDMMELRTAYRLLRYYEVDIVSAFRFDRTGEGAQRLIYSRVYNALIRLVFGLRVKDVNFSFKLVRRRIFDQVEIKAEGSFIDAELLAKANRCGYKLIQFGTNYFPRSRGVSTLSSPGVIIDILKNMFSLYRDIKAIKPSVNE